VVGGGNRACEEGLFLTSFVSKLTMLVRGDSLRATKIIADKVMRDKQIEVRFNTQISALHGEKKLAGVTLLNNKTGETEEAKPAGVFVFIGLTPNAGWVPDEIKRDEQGFIVTDGSLMTSCPGVFAAGDVRKGATKQVASAVGEGATAALMIREYLKRM